MKGKNMNKRIKKKRLKKSELMRYEYTQRIIQDVVYIAIFSCPVEKGNFPIRPLRYRTFLKKRRLHKRYTQFGSKNTKYDKFNGDVSLAIVPIKSSTNVCEDFV